MLNTKVWEKACGLARTVVEGVRVDDTDGSIVVSVRPSEGSWPLRTLPSTFASLRPW